MNSYQKLKIQNEKLRRDIYLLVKEMDTNDGIVTHMKWSVLFDIEENTMQGDSTITEDDNSFKGILGQ